MDTTENRLVVAIAGFAAEESLFQLKGLGDVVFFADSKVTTIQEKASLVGIQLPESFENIDIIGFSQGALVATLVATEVACRHPETLRRLILITPAGFIEDDSTARLACRFILQILEEGVYVLKCAFHLNFKPLRDSIKVGSVLLKNCLRKRHVWQEVSEIAQAKVVPSLHDLKKRGVEIILITANSDRVFPEKRIAKTLRGELNLVDRWLSFPEERASHGTPYFGEIGSIIRQILAGEN